MSIEFGKIQEYISDRGFGFIGRTFLNYGEKVFFHIEKLKDYPELAQRLDNNESFERIHLWYEIEITAKGERVNRFWLKAKDIPQQYANELSNLVQKIESLWKDINYKQPNWLENVTVDLVGVKRRNELSVERTSLEFKLKKAEIQQQNEVTRIVREHKINNVEAEELYKLIKEMRSLKFTNSSQLSNYIVKHKLGYKYPKISGILKMSNGEREWDFHGGFPSDIYHIVCKELGLDNFHTEARPIDFTPYQEAKKIRGHDIFW